MSVYHLWENRFREEIALDRGLNKKNDLLNQHMADLAKIRHDILKCRGVATSKNSGKCVDLRWFNVGDEIFIQDWMVYEFMEAFGLVYPGSGELDPDQIRYKFHGIVQSPVELRAEVAEDLLFGEIRSLSGRPVQLDSLRDIFKGFEFYVDGPGGGGTARGVDVFPVEGNDKAATLVAYAGRDFVQKVRDGRASANLPLGASVPRVETRRAVPTRWTRGPEVVAEALAPVGHWYDLEPYEQAIGTWLPLVSDVGDMYEGQLRAAVHGPRDRRRLLLTLSLDETVAAHVKGRQAQLYVPLDLHG
ncbi:hypothetical protein ACVGVM_24645 [Pseudonocardia bannensis]|uniref:Uncharacterized protein n=1 Tax=Pseudonocardia bannensis TaxID=630973 RepID=A0A848DCX2_9PSEU|nr:hypothetical protein [Pseudonocardia bannensis]NMH90458.1 hypothetical protein [Pseudonocardia bannensis]